VSAEQHLWQQLRHLFEEDDGSLPEIVLGNLRGSDPQNLFEFLRDRAGPDALDDQTLWDEELESDVPVVERPNAAELVATGRLQSFHVVFRGLCDDDTEIAPIGAFFLSDEVCLDYRMGEAWDADVLAAFMRLVAHMKRLVPHAQVAALPDGWRSWDERDPRFDQVLDGLRNN
jgi:hypothetical protein